MASGRLNRRPSTRPTIHPGQERLTAPTTNPMAKRFMKAPRIAALLSGKLMGSMIATSRAPKARPQTTPSITRDIVVFGALNTHQATHQCSASTGGNFELTDYRVERWESQSCSVFLRLCGTCCSPSSGLGRYGRCPGLGVGGREFPATV